MGENGKLDAMQEQWEREMADAGVPTEAEMREMEAPWPESAEELAEYVEALVDRPHSYGTCVYAMSLAAAAAFRYVAKRLGVTRFQASMADLDILRQTRGWKWGRLLDYEKLLYPQYCTDEHFPSWRSLVEANREELAKRAEELLAEKGEAHPHVTTHWRWLAGIEA